MGGLYDYIWVSFDHWLDDLGLFEQDHTLYKHSAVYLDVILFSIPIVIFFLLSSFLFLLLLFVVRGCCMWPRPVVYFVLFLLEITFLLEMFFVCFLIAFIISGHGFTLFHSSIFGIILSTLACFFFFSAAYRGSVELYRWTRDSLNGVKSPFPRTPSDNMIVTVSSPGMEMVDCADEVDDITFCEQIKSPVYTQCADNGVNSSPSQCGNVMTSSEAERSFNEYQIETQKRQMKEIQRVLEGVSGEREGEGEGEGDSKRTQIASSSSSSPSLFLTPDRPHEYDDVIQNDTTDHASTRSFSPFLLLLLLSLSLSLSLEGVCDAYTPLEYSTTLSRALSPDLCERSPCFVYTMLPTSAPHSSIDVIFHSPTSLKGKVTVRYSWFRNGSYFDTAGSDVIWERFPFILIHFKFPQKFFLFMK